MWSHVIRHPVGSPVSREAPRNAEVRAKASGRIHVDPIGKWAGAGEGMHRVEVMGHLGDRSAVIFA
jgi:hypothetical protein